MQNPFEVLYQLLTENNERMKRIEAALIEQDKEHIPEKGGYEFAAEYLGKKKKTLYRYKSEDRIPYRIEKGKVVFYRVELDKWIAMGQPTFQQFKRASI